MTLCYTQRAKNDLELAFAWYEKQRQGLGYEFLDCVEISVKAILEYPEMNQLCYSYFRRSIIRRFPFSIFYTIGDNEILIHAVFHNRQDPKKRPE